MYKFRMVLFTLLMFVFSACGGGGSDGGTVDNNNTTPIEDDNPISVISPHDASFTSQHFSGSQNCAQCHDGLVDNQGNDVSIGNAWESTMMANSTKDPLWKAKVASEIKRNPHLEGVINDKCTKCHAPMANHEAHTMNESVKVFDDGFLNPNNSHHNEAMDGVSCTACHQISDSEKLGTLSGFSGNYEINTNRFIYGPYSNVETNPMQNQVNYTPVYSSHIQESKFCATCHNLKTPFVDADGNLASTTDPASEFPEQMPYTEWEHSDFKTTKSCQDCHMEKADGVKIASRPPWLETKRDNFSKHTFIGGNKLMLDILKNNKEQLGINTAVSFENVLNKTEEILQSAANITLLNQTTIGNTLNVELKLTSETGHKLPTSFPSRRAFIHFTLYDGSDNILFESGKVNADGSIVGANGDTDRTQYEPHYNTISSENQVQIYEAIMQNTDSEVTYTLLRAASYKKDNRILPKGFDKNNVPSDIAVSGNALGDDDFIGGSDTITYSIDTTAFATTASRVEIELLYQTLSYPFAQDLFSDKTSQSESFRGMFEASNVKTTAIATHSFSL